MAENYDVIVIGSGPGGYVAAIRAAQLGLKTACVEMTPELGGTCLNVGCIPSKSLLQSTELLAKLQNEGKLHGINAGSLNVDFPAMMQRKSKIITSFNEGIAGLFKKNRITRVFGKARLQSPNQVSVQSAKESLMLQGNHIILATGSEAIPLPFLPFDEKKILSSTGALSLEKIPRKMLVVGAGVIGVELGSVYRRLGTEVVFIEFLDRVCSILDDEVSKAFQVVLEKQGLVFHLGAKVTQGQVKGDGVTLGVTLSDGSNVQFDADVALISIGRRPYTKDLGLENVGIQPGPKGFLAVDGHFRTSVPSIFAIGDIIDGPMLAHKASEEGSVVAEIIGGLSPHINYAAIPSVVYTHPEVAAVGLTESEAKQRGLAVRTGKFPFKANSRARCSHEEEGFVKIVTEEKSDRILGVHILGAHASELIAVGVVAIEKKMTALELAQIPYAHPTLSEAIKEAALAVHKRPIHL